MDLLKRTWAQIDLDHLEYNYRALRGHTGPHSRYMGIVKADAYGHGAVQISRALAELGADYLAVSNLEEALQLRRQKVELPILLLGYTPVKYCRDMVALGVQQEIHSLEYARQLNAQLEGTDQSLTVHLKIDTGMSRLGITAVPMERAVEEIMQILRLPHLHAEGIFTHFSVSDSTAPDDRAYTQAQFAAFTAVCDAIRQAGAPALLRHCANSGAAIQYPEYALDMIRPGIATYGLSPAPELAPLLPLRPVMTLYTTISQVREFAPGTSVSYGRTYRTSGAQKIAVLAVGYADGLPRRLSNNASFLLRGRKVPLVGRVCMDMCMVDVTAVPEAAVGDEVILFGAEPGANSWDDLAAQLGTISYELTCDVNKRMPRVYLKNGRQVGILQYIV